MTSFIAGRGSGRSTSFIPAVPAAWSVTTIAFIGIVSSVICVAGGKVHGRKAPRPGAMKVVLRQPGRLAAAGAGASGARPPEPHSAPARAQNHQNVGFVRGSERRCRDLNVRCETLLEETAPKTAPYINSRDRCS